MSHDNMIRVAQPGVPATYGTGRSHYLLLGDWSWQVCDQCVTIDHSHCKEVGADAQEARTR